MREPPTMSNLNQRIIRITPACAGTTWRAWLGTNRIRDHPRVCGNHYLLKNGCPYILGSPPRVREPHTQICLPESFVRITPACAGTTHSAQRICQGGQDHPRVCGNHLHLLHRTTRTLGSPPRVREPHQGSGSACREDRITPACAGTTYFWHIRRAAYQDHPRVCGNHIFLPFLRVSLTGSPPRVREPRRVRSASSFANRITPACAGTTTAFVTRQ